MEAGIDLPKTRSIALTAFAGSGVKTKALESGFHLCLVKPIQPLPLVQAIANVVKKSENGVRSSS